MSFSTALSGLNGAQTELATMANNIANVSTNGFKRSRVAFGDIIATSPLQNPARAIGSGTYVKSVSQQFQQGAIETTDSSLDLAISGQGFGLSPVVAIAPKGLKPNRMFTVRGSSPRALTNVARSPAACLDGRPRSSSMSTPASSKTPSSACESAAPVASRA